MMHGQEKSDRLTVPEKLSNKAERSAAQKAEGRSLAKGNLPQDDTNRMQGRRQVNKCPQADTSSSRARQEGEVHLAPAPYLRRGHASGGVLQPRAESRAGRRQGDLAALRRRPEEHLQDLYLHVSTRRWQRPASPSRDSLTTG